MYDYAYIIDELVRHEEQRKKEWEPAPLRIPYPEQDPRTDRKVVDENEPQRGVVIIDFGGDE